MQHVYNLNHLPLGYRPGSGEKASIPVPDETLARHIRIVFARAADLRRTLYDVSVALAGEGFVTRAGKPYSVHFLLKMIRNPFYAGFVRRDGRLVRGAHRAIIDKPTYFFIRQLYWPEPGFVPAATGFVLWVLWRFTRPRDLA